MRDLIITAILAYLLGSIPFGLLLTRLGGAGDIRQIGSGNIGATNVLRTGRRDLAVATLLLDGGKGALAVLLAGWWAGADAALIAGAAVVIGHLFPVWLGFKGGKGVATALGVLLALDPLVGAIACLVWLLVAFASRYSSLAALVAIGTAPITAWLATGRAEAILAAILAVLVFIRHHENIGRLVQGSEGKIKLGRG